MATSLEKRTAARNEEAARANETERPATVRVVIAARRSLIVPIRVGQRQEGDKTVDLFASRSVGPGEMVEVSFEEAALLRARGYIEPGVRLETPPPAPVSTQYGDDPVPTINGRDGATINAGEA